MGRKKKELHQESPRRYAVPSKGMIIVVNDATLDKRHANALTFRKCAYVERVEGLFVTLRIYDKKGELVPYVHNYRIQDFQMGFLVFEEVEKPILGASWEALSVTYIREKKRG